jgi:hypothetical protein
MYSILRLIGIDLFLQPVRRWDNYLIKSDRGILGQIGILHFAISSSRKP